MTQALRRWRIGWILTACAWLVTLVALIISMVRFETEPSSGMAVASFWLAVLAGTIAFVAAVVALRAMRRQQTVEHELRTARETFEGILMISADAIISIDDGQRVTHFNNGAAALFGYAPEEIVGQKLERLIPGRFRPAHEGHIDAFAHGNNVARRMGERRSIFGLRRDGREFPAEASISKLDVEGTRHFTVVLRDITERIRGEERQRFLARASAELSSSLELEPTLILACHVGVPFLADCVIIDLVEPGGGVRRRCSVHDDANLARVLKAMERRFGDAPNAPFPVADVLASGTPVVATEPVRASPRDGSAESLGVRGFIALPLRTRERVFGVLTLVSTTETRTWAEDDVDLASAFAERLGVAIDNATLYRDSRRASQARDEILGVVSHDLRNPLSAIAMGARVLAEHPPDDAPERAKLARGILDATALMHRLIQDLLDVVSVESGHLRVDREEADASALARQALSMVAEQAAERGIRIETNLPEHLPCCLDTLRVEQVLANLLNNAVKFTDRGGSVALDLRAADEGCRFEVRDTGIGIPPDALPHIFDRYWHSHRAGRKAGSGLGLAIAKGIVDAHGGVFEVTSTVGVGTRIVLHIPNGTVVSDASLATPIPTGASRPALT
ncbi:MAG: PAS domain S-box protein [Cytophagaceae bacterium]|nr:PAS domain S-box protein [Gemmatimonadaceae bacterium]